MQYRSPPQSGPDVLREDRRRMHEMTQPDLVKQQLSELFCSLGREVGAALDVGDLHPQQFPQVLSSSDPTQQFPQVYCLFCLNCVCPVCFSVIIFFSYGACNLIFV